MAEVIALVVAVQGEVIARAPDGSERVLAVGDEIFENEIIITGEGARITLDSLDGQPFVVEANQETLMSRELAGREPPTEDESVVTDAAVAQVIEALEAGEDLLEVLDPAAAGPGGADGGGGRSFVQLARIVEQTGDLAFAFPQNLAGSTPVAEVLPQLEAVAETVAGTPAPVVTPPVVEDETEEPEIILPPGDEDPIDEDPIDEDPGDEDPGDEDPGDEDPGDEDPGDEDPGDEDPGDEDPETPEEPEIIVEAAGAYRSGQGASQNPNATGGSYANANGLQQNALDGDGNPVSRGNAELTIDGDGFYGVRHTASENVAQWDPTVINNTESVVIKLTELAGSATFEFRGDIGGAQYSLYDENGARVGGSNQSFSLAEEVDGNGLATISFDSGGGATGFLYIAFDGGSGSSFAVKPVSLAAFGEAVENDAESLDLALLADFDEPFLYDSEEPSVLLAQDEPAGQDLLTGGPQGGDEQPLTENELLASEQESLIPGGDEQTSDASGQQGRGYQDAQLPEYAFIDGPGSQDADLPVTPLTTDT
ncbi:retention module-containing protein [Methylonatrum kenyense]|uniref:retention module-containing protein n=1 Tax=Methylonatrum kenyense TaxID=455253 RepID=UPI0020BF48EF|nr:retention module-containing protein [Methylonatrum kenyense]MCK8515469.1 retention module-containing protein [Methylonatrum kenyense]